MRVFQTGLVARGDVCGDWKGSKPRSGPEGKRRPKAGKGGLTTRIRLSRLAPRTPLHVASAACDQLFDFASGESLAVSAKRKPMPVSLRLRDFDAKRGAADWVELEGQVADLKAREIAELGAKNELCAAASWNFVARVRDETLTGPGREHPQETVGTPA